MGGRNPAHTQLGKKKYIKALMFIYLSDIKELWIIYTVIAVTTIKPMAMQYLWY